MFSSIFWMYFSYVLSFIIPLFCGITLLTIKGESSNKQAGIHPRSLLGVIFILTGFLFILNMTQNIQKFYTGELGLPAFDIAINLVLIPLYFFYFRKVTKPQRLNRWKITRHLLPAIIVFILALFIFPLQEDTAQFKQTYTIANPIRMIFQYICLIVQMVMIIIYATCILRFKKQHIQELENNYSSTENIDLKWLDQAIPLAIVYAVIALAMSAIQSTWSDYLFHLTSIFFIFYLFIHALNEPYIYYTTTHPLHILETPVIPCEKISLEEIEAEIKPEPELSSVFPPLPEKYLKNLGEKREKMKDELICLFDQKEIYTNGNLTINDVANLLGTNRTYVSNVINNEFGFSFYQFVNKYRIQKATILLLEHPEMQIQEVATLSGFNSLSSFISSFKLNEGITPKQWKQRYATPL